MIYLWALCLANEFMSLSLGEEDLVITKCYHCQHISCWGEAGKEIPAQLPCYWSLLPPVFGAVRGKTIVQLQPSLLKGCCLVSEPLGWGEATECNGKTHTFVPSHTRSSLFCYCTKAPSLAQLGHGVCGTHSPILQQKVEEEWDFGQNTVKRRLDCGPGGDSASLAWAQCLPIWQQNPQMASNFAEDSLLSIPIHSRATSHHARAASLLWFRIQSCCLPPSPSLWVPGEFQGEDGWGADLCHRTRDRPKSWSTIWYWFYSL